MKNIDQSENQENQMNEIEPHQAENDPRPEPRSSQQYNSREKKMISNENAVDLTDRTNESNQIQVERAAATYATPDLSDEQLKARLYKTIEKSHHLSMHISLYGIHADRHFNSISVFKQQMDTVSSEVLNDLEEQAICEMENDLGDWITNISENGEDDLWDLLKQLARAAWKQGIFPEWITKNEIIPMAKLMHQEEPLFDSELD